MEKQLTKSKVFVTGADGFIGSHVVQELVNFGYQVKALVQYNSLGSVGWLKNLDKDIFDEVEICSGDVRDYDQMELLIRNCDYLLHLAALIAIPYSYTAPRSYFETNLSGSFNVFQAALKNKIKKIIHTSTSEVFGTATYVPIDEKHPYYAQSPYAASKAAADQLANSFYSSYELPVTILRPFNTFGPRQSARAVIPTIISQVISGRRQVKMGNLDSLRDFTYVTDTARGFRNALEFSEGKGEHLNLGTGYEVSMGDLANSIAKLADVEIEILVENERIRPLNSEVQRLLADSSLAQKQIKWDPKYVGSDGLASALQETITWFRNPANLALYTPGDYVV